MDGSAGAGGEQQFCLRWNNFQANITSQFEALRDDEELVDVTLAVEGQRLEAHKVVLSACSPYFKDLFKNNPCPHPIIFMRDCEASHVRALLQFMYAGQVNIAQAQLSAFLRTADALQIRGLTDSSTHSDKRANRKSPPSQLRHLLSSKPPSTSSASAKAAAAAAAATCHNAESSPEVEREHDAEKRARRRSRASADHDDFHISSQPRDNNTEYIEANNLPTIRVKTDLEERKEEAEACAAEADVEMCAGAEYEGAGACGVELLEPKLEVVERDYEGSDEERSPFPHMYYRENNALANPFAALAVQGNMDILAGLKPEMAGDNSEGKWGSRRGRPVPDAVWLEQHRRALPFALKRENTPAAAPKLIKLGEGVEVREELLRGVKWGDYRKVTRGLAAALFSPVELATCSVTGQRWSRAGQESRPTKPPLDRRRVHALISYVSRHFPDVEVSRIKQVLAYKCKENCAALRMRTASESTNFLLGGGGGAGGGAQRPPACDVAADHTAASTASRAFSHFAAGCSDAKSFLMLEQQRGGGGGAGEGGGAESGGGEGGGDGAR